MQENRKLMEGLMSAAISGIKKHPGQLIRVLLCQLLLRFLALTPALLGILGAGGGSIPPILFYALTVLLYVLLVMPFRFRAGVQLRLLAADGGKKADMELCYFRWLKLGLIRLLRGLPFGIPVFAVLGYLVIGSKVLPYNQMWRPVQNLALIFGMEPTLLYGILAGIPIFLLLVLLSCLGWLRDMPSEYRLPCDQPWNRSKRKEARGSMLKNFGVNTLLFLPALLGACGVIIPYIFSNVNFSGSVLMTIRDMTNLMDQPVPAGLLMLLIGDFLILYLPLCALRKMRNAALTEKLLGGHHAAG